MNNNCRLICQLCIIAWWQVRQWSHLVDESWSARRAVVHWRQPATESRPVEYAINAIKKINCLTALLKTHPLKLFLDQYCVVCCHRRTLGFTVIWSVNISKRDTVCSSLKFATENWSWYRKMKWFSEVVSGLYCCWRGMFLDAVSSVVACHA